MLKKFLPVLLILLTAILGGCFGKKDSNDSGKGVELVREANRVKVLAEDEIAGGSFIIDRELEPDNILVEADKMKIVKIAEGKTYLSIVDVDAPSVEGDKLFEIKNCIGKISIELEDSINEKTVEKKMKKAFKNAEKKGMRATTSDALLGDFNKDEVVDITDFMLFKANYETTAAAYDIAPSVTGSGDYAEIYSIVTPDGSVGLLDFLVFGRNYGKSIKLATVTEVKLRGASTVEIGNTIDIYAEVLYSNNTTKSEVVEWSTSDETVALQTPNGEWTRVTGVKTGTVTIKASKNGKVGELTVNVNPKGSVITQSLEITGGNGVTAGNTLKLKATATMSDGTVVTEGAVWTSTNTSVATVDSTGKVTGITAGKTKIKAVKDGISHEITVVVTAQINGIKIHAKGYKTIHAWIEGTTDITLTGAWPGTALIAEETAGWGYYYIEGKDLISCILVDASGGKTGDLVGISKGEHWYMGGKWYDYDPAQDFIAPVITATPESGKNEAASLEVVLSATDISDTNSKIYYTTDGTVPNTNSTVFSGNITIKSDTTIKAIAADSNGNISKIYLFEYKLNQDITPPVITASLEQGRYDDAQTVKFTAKDNRDTNVTMYYSVDGTAPKAELSYMYNGQLLNITKSSTIRVMAVDNFGNSKTESFQYTIGKLVKVNRDDFREESIYFLLPTRFYDGDSSNNRYTRGDLGEYKNYLNNDPSWRGDFKGLIEKLDYIKALGFTAVWITPPVLNRGDYDFHGYHGYDFKKIDKRLESPGATYQDLINACHSKGLKIIQDIVLNHSGRYGMRGLQTPKFYGDDQDTKWGYNGTLKYYDRYNPNFEYDGLSVEPLSGKSFYNGDTWTKENPNYSWNPLSDWGTYVPSWGIWKYMFDTLDVFDPKYFHKDWIKNWEDETCQTGAIAGDCIDLNTESPEVQKYLIDAYTGYINMGVDAFRVDTVKHINRLVLNRRFNPAFNKAGGSSFYMFGEVCCRVGEIWNKGNAPLSVPSYTWKERKEFSADDSVAVHEQYAYEYGQGTANQPTSDNAFLNGNEYHTPDYSKFSGMGVIDFRMHWNFQTASKAFGVRDSDKYYNDATWNVTYVNSHDYTPNEGPSNTYLRYTGGTDAWAENMDLMWTFRGIPCLFYGDEIEFKKGIKVDRGDLPADQLENTGRAYYGAHLEGSVTATDFGSYTGATGAIKETLEYPLAKHLMRLNKIRRAIPALQKGQYSTEGITGNMAFKKRYTNTVKGVDSFVLVTISGDAKYTGIPNGKYTDAVTGDIKTVTDGTLSVTCTGQGNMRVYVLSTTLTPAPGKIGAETGDTYLK